MSVSRLPAGFFLPLFFVLLYVAPLDLPFFWQPDETRYAEISREMLESGDWVVPRLLGLRYFEKPVAGYWLNTISQSLFGQSNFSARFGSAFSTGASAALVFCLALLMWRRKDTAYTASLIYLSTGLVVGVGTYAALDPMLSMWMTAAMLCSYLALNARTRSRRAGAHVLLGLACGMGFMTKGFIALAIPAISVFPAAVLQGRLRELFLLGPAAVLAAILISLPWSIAVAVREPDYWRYFFWVEHIQRFAADNAQHASPFWFYALLLAVTVVPWAGFLPGALYQGWKQRLLRPELFFLLSWFVMPFLFFSVARGKILTYILPCMAPLALLMAAYVRERADGAGVAVFKANAGINMVAALVCMAVICIVGLGFFPLDVPLYAREWYKPVTGCLLLLLWCLLCMISFRRPAKCWFLAAACPLLLYWGYVFLLPDSIAESKQPQIFIRRHLAALENSRHVLANDPGVATGLAWELRRTDILMYNKRGELAYGLERADGPARMIDASVFPAWLEQARSTGNTALLIRSSKDTEHWLSVLPPPDALSRTGRHMLFLYNRI